MLAVTDHPLTTGVLDLQRPQGRAPGGPLREHQGVVAYRFGRCEVRPACREVFVDGARRRLQPRAFDLLIYLIDHRHRVLSIDELLDAVLEIGLGQLEQVAKELQRLDRVEVAVEIRFLRQIADERLGGDVPGRVAEHLDLPARGMEQTE